MFTRISNSPTVYGFTDLLYIISIVQVSEMEGNSTDNNLLNYIENINSAILL